MERRVVMSEKRKDFNGRVLKTGESQRKDGVYQFRYTQRGKRYTVYASSLKELREKEQQIERDIEDGIDYLGGKITVSELAEKHLSLKTHLKENTKNNYKELCKLVKASDFGQMQIANVKMSDAKRWLLEVYEYRKSYNSILTIQVWIKSVFKMGCQDGLIRTNPFDFKLSSIIKDNTKKREALTKEQQISLIRFLRSGTMYSKYYNEIYILLNTGLRVGEFFGLTVDSLDFKNKKIIVDKQLQRINNGKVYIDTLKTKNAYRVIPMTEEVEYCLKDVLSKDKDKRQAISIDGFSGFLFFNTQGHPKTLRNLQNSLHNVITAHNKKFPDNPIPQITPHVLRHTFCTNLINAGVGIKDVQYLMGHSSVAITLDIYTHTDIQAAGDSMVKALDELDLLHQFGKSTTPIITPIGVTVA